MPNNGPNNITSESQGKAETRTTARDVLNAVFARHDGPEWVRFSEVADDTGSRIKRRADAVCMNIWPSKGYAIHGFEIKVSRADFIKEMQDITKATAVSRFCDFWWLATPAGLVSVDEVPVAWGLMELCGQTLRIKKQAPASDPEAPTRGFMSAMLRKSRDSDNALIASEVDRQVKIIEARLKRDVERRVSRAVEDAELNRKWIADFEDSLGMPFECWQKPDAVAERLRLAKGFEFGHVARLSESLVSVLHDLGKLGKAMPDGRGGDE